MGSGLDTAWSVDDLRRLARARLPRPVFDFYDGGAEDECTLRANAQAFGLQALVPRAFVDVSAATTRTRLLGSDTAMPLAIAPMGGVGFAWRDGDIALARAAAAAGVPYTLSTMAAATIEEVARRASGRLWFQAHLLRPRERTLELVDRAAAAGYEALMITADVPVGGKRERDLRNDLALPFRFTRRNLAGFAARPAWSIEMLVRGAPGTPNLPVPAARAAGSSIAGDFDAGFDWDALAQLRSRWCGKLVVKGILHAVDAQRAVQLGVDAVVVSNHGGRQLDGCIATLDALPAIAAEVGGRATVLLDGGIRRGRDILKAMAMGADGVLLGRAALFGVAAGGEAGAARCLQLLQAELLSAMQLCGLLQLPPTGGDWVRGSHGRST